MKDIIRMNQLAGLITEGQARKMMQVLNENIGSTDSVKLFDFPQNINDVDSYEEMGFKVEIDDETNETYYASLSFKGHDWMAVLSILDDCENYNLRPNLEYDGKVYNFDEAYKLVDDKANDDVLNNMKKMGLNVKKMGLNEENGTKSLKDFVEEYITDIDDFMNDDYFINKGEVMFTIPYTENNSSEDPALPSKDVSALENLLQQKGIKILKKGIMKDGGYKYTEIKVKYDDLKNKLND